MLSRESSVRDQLWDRHWTSPHLGTVEGRERTIAREGRDREREGMGEGWGREGQGRGKGEGVRGVKEGDKEELARQ